MNKKNNYVFLIGGYNLEMQEIAKILEKGNYKYVNEKLKSGIKLSSYKYFNKNTFVGIELIADCDQTENYVGVDHNNKNLPSSIQQVVNLLSIELNRRLIYISANDGENIKELVKEDFKDNLFIIQSSVNIFSGVCGAVFVSKESFEKYKKVIIYDKNKTDYCFYSKDRNILFDFEEIIKKEITPDSGYSFSGGSEELGFFGVGFNTPNIDKARGVVEKIKEIL